MNEAKEIGKARAKQVVRKNSRWVEIAVSGLLLVELYEQFSYYIWRLF